MTRLIRARGATSEMARLFDAEPEPGLNWREIVWPGDSALLVTQEDGQRRLSTMPWGLPALSFARPVTANQRGTMFVRDLVEGGRLDEPRQLRRCLIVVEAFAYPSGETGRCTRSWFGLSDRPLVAWAGVCTAGGNGCAGLLMNANQTIAPLSNHMPRLLAPHDHATWLRGGLLALSSPEPDADHYHENFGERWSTGALLDQFHLGFVASA
jgi:putative SOS response-associated peptidase YedK